jgi:hypothetical protein
MAGNIDELSTAMRAQVGPLFSDFGLALDTFQVESLSLPDELQKLLDQRIGMNMVGDMRQYAQIPGGAVDADRRGESWRWRRHWRRTGRRPGDGESDGRRDFRRDFRRDLAGARRTERRRGAVRRDEILF